MKRKKKGRPSLLDLQKRTLRLHQNKTPNPNSKLCSGRRITRRNPNPDDHSCSDEEGEDSAGKRRRRREKKLKLVDRIPDSADVVSGSDKEEKNNSSKATDAHEEEPLDSGPSTPLPDKKLLVFILDRLQKKDTYGVFSEPVEPEELPDYHEIIEHPMDFGTVRKKLATGAYSSLEQFEKDVFLISSNAMCYNAQDTIYYRQARAIRELAEKNFENLRQESDDNETKPKTIVRRGRPPSKNVKHTVDHAASDFPSDAMLANAGEDSNLANDLSRKVTGSGMACAGDISPRTTYNLCNTESYSWLSMYKSERNEDFPGTALKGISAMHGKKHPVADENRRNTYCPPQPSTSRCESSILSTFDRERKHLMPQIGLKLEHAYARSLARFAAKLGPIGWDIAAKNIERVLPQGTRYGRGWIGANEAPNYSQPSMSFSSPNVPSHCKIPMSTITPLSSKLTLRPEASSTDLADEDGNSIITPPPASMSIPSSRSSSSMEVGGEPAGGLTHGRGPNLPSSDWDGNENNNIQFNSPSELHQNEGPPSSANGHTSKPGFSLLSHVGIVGRPVQLSGSSGSEEAMIHARAFDMVTRRNVHNNTNSIHQMPKNHLEAESGKLASNVATTISGNFLPDQGLGQDSQRSLRSLPQQPKQDVVPPDLNVRFQSLVSSLPGSMVNSKQPELGPLL